MVPVVVTVGKVKVAELIEEVVRPQSDITEVLLSPNGEGLLHTGASLLLVQFCKQPQSVRGGSGFVSVQHVSLKETALQFEPSVTFLKKVSYWSLLIASTAISKCHSCPKSFTSPALHIPQCAERSFAFPAGHSSITMNVRACLSRATPTAEMGVSV